jgi:hypothetical protein
MKQQPDHFFRKQLQSATKTPRPDLWNRIEEGMEKKKQMYFFRSIAASILVLAVGSYAYTTWKPDNSLIAEINDKKIVGAVPLVRPQNEKTSPLSEKKDDHPLKSESLNDQSSLELNLRNRTPSREEIVKARQEKVSEKILADNPLKEVNYSKQNSIIESKATEYNTTLAFKGSELKSLTIILTSDQTNQYLTKKATTEATPGEKKTSTLKKLLQKATDLKSNQNPFGDLRQKKNEILALNFISDKQRGQKK